MTGTTAADHDALCEALLQLKTREECHRFLLDLCTPAEIKAFEERWKIARILEEGQTSYREIHAATGVSLTTIGRVARFLLQEPHHGYTLVLKRIRRKKAKA